MQIEELSIPGVYLVVPTPVEDERGFFARTWCMETFAGKGLSAGWTQSSVSYNRRCGTLRGLHYQAAPAEEVKLVRCTRGAIYDVVVDVRPGPTRGKWAAVELTARNRHSLYIPQGVAHGFQTLMDDSEVFYQISAAYRPELQRGVLWNSPALGIVWPDCPVRVISERDRNFSPW